jgi:carbonic anhydrase/acetyltransferase-like protein (isoleucine patch superfamily)
VAVRREPVKARLLQDVLRLIFWGLLLGGASYAAYFPPPTHPYWLDVTGRVMAFFFAELVILAVLRELVPKPHAGAHKVGNDKEYVRWLISQAFTDVAMHPVIRTPFWSFHTTRVLFLKALGARVSFSVAFSAHTVIREPVLLSIGVGSQLEPGVTIEAALHGAGRIRVAGVIIGQGCLVGAHSILMPGATVGHDVRIEPAAIIGEDVRVGVGASIGEGVRLEKGVDLGSYASIGTGAIISEGVRIGDRAKVAPGAIVEPHTEIGERELWEGAPAQRVVGELYSQ